MNDQIIFDRCPLCGELTELKAARINDPRVGTVSVIRCCTCENAVTMDFFAEWISRRMRSAEELASKTGGMKEGRS